MNGNINMQQQPTLRLPNGNVITHFQISNNVQFPVNYSIDNMATKLVQNEASRKIQDNLTRFIIKYSNMKSINMNSFFNYNGTTIQPIIIYTFFTRENDFNKINWQPIIQRLNSNNGNTDGLLEKIETIWNLFIRPFSDWLHNDPVIKEEYRQSKLDIEKIIFDQKDKLSVKIQITIREKYGINMPLAEALQAKVDHQLFLMRQNQQPVTQTTLTPTQSAVQTPVTANGKPPPKKRGRKSKKEKEAMLLAQEQNALLGNTNAGFTPSAKPSTPTVKKKKKLTKKEIEHHNELLSKEINRQTAYLLQQHAQRTAKIPKVYKNKSTKNYTPIRYPLSPPEKEGSNTQELQLLRNLEFLQPKLEPNLDLPLEVSSQTLNSLLLVSQKPEEYDCNIVSELMEDLIKLGDGLIRYLLNENDNSGVCNIKFNEEEGRNVPNQSDSIVIKVDALTGVEVKNKTTPDEASDSQVVSLNEGSFSDPDLDLDLCSESLTEDTFYLIPRQENAVFSVSLQDALVENFFNLSDPIITENFLQSSCDNDGYFKVLKLLTVITILKNASLDRTKFLAINYGYESRLQSFKSNASSMKQTTKRSDSISNVPVASGNEEKKLSSFPHFFKIFNKFICNCSQTIIKNSNMLTYTDFMKCWFLITLNICEQLSFTRQDPCDIEFLQDLVANLKFFTNKSSFKFENDFATNKLYSTTGPYVTDIVMKLYYVNEANSIIIDDLILKDHVFIDDLARMILKECLNHESVNWRGISLAQFEELLPSLLQPLNCLHLLLTKKVAELRNIDANDTESKEKVQNCIAKWITDYDMMNTLAILFQFSHKVMVDVIAAKTNHVNSNKKVSSINKNQALLQKYEYLLKILVNILNSVYGIINDKKELKLKLLAYKCNFIKNSTLLELILSNKFKSLNPKLSLLMNNQYIVEKSFIL